MNSYSSYKEVATFLTHFISRKHNEHLLWVTCYASIGDPKKNKKQFLPQGNVSVQ